MINREQFTFRSVKMKILLPQLTTEWMSFRISAAILTFFKLTRLIIEAGVNCCIEDTKLLADTIGNVSIIIIHKLLFRSTWDPPCYFSVRVSAPGPSGWETSSCELKRHLEGSLTYFPKTARCEFPITMSVCHSFIPFIYLYTHRKTDSTRRWEWAIPSNVCSCFKGGSSGFNYRDLFVSD